MEVGPDIWRQFERFMLTRLHYNPKTTIKDRIRKLKHLEKQGFKVKYLNVDNYTLRSL